MDRTHYFGGKTRFDEVCSWEIVENTAGASPVFTVCHMGESFQD